MKILAIESSCDETAAAVVENGTNILGSVIASQIDIHAQFGGVVPEVAARSHIEVILPIIDSALDQANCDWNDIDAIAVTRGPGLIGSLLIGVMTAKTLARVKNKPLIGVNHIMAHAFAAFLDTPSSDKNNTSQAKVIITQADVIQGGNESRSAAYFDVREARNEAADTVERRLGDNQEPEFPMLALTVSGGHSALTLYQEDLSFETIGETRDDAAGEAFDKVGKLLGLPYPGGPAVSKAAHKGNPEAYKFPIAKLGDSLDFSFSGLKTAVLRQVHEISPDGPNNLRRSYKLPEQTVIDIAAGFEVAAITPLVHNTVRAAKIYQPASIVIGGGVAANARLRLEMQQALPQAIFVKPALCGDNAAMIGALAHKMHALGHVVASNAITADSSLEVL